MARSDPPLQGKVPQFVHDELESLLQQLGEGSKTRLVAALIHAADAETAREALREYAEELARRGRR
jgi:cellobiose-specific phosphotransferase system component IIA